MNPKDWNYFVFKASYPGHSRSIDVLSPSEEIARLAIGLFEDEALELKKEMSGRLVLANKSKISPKELVLFLKNLQKCMRRGASVPEALKLTAAAVRKPLTRGVIAVLIESTLKHGRTLSESMEMLGGVFDPVTIALVKAGERSGELCNVLKDLVVKLEASEKIKSKTLAGLYYPMAVIVITLIAAAIVNFFVFPSIMQNFKTLGAELPWITQIMSSVVSATSSSPVMMLAPIMIIASLFLLRRQITASKYFQTGILKLPVLGDLIGSSILVRALYVLSLLQKTGTNVVDAYTMTMEVAGNVKFKQYFGAILECIKHGESPDRAYAKNRHLIGKHGTEVANLMQITQFTGEEWKAIGELADSLGEEVQIKAEGLPKLIEPILLLFIAIIVGLMIAAIYLPSFYLLLNAFKH